MTTTTTNISENNSNPYSTITETIIFSNKALKKIVTSTLDINLSDIEPLNLYDNPNRDPRGWTITNAHILFQNPTETIPFNSPISWARITETEILINNQSISLTFDHRQIIADALTQFKKWSLENPKQLKLLGDTFTIPQAIQLLNLSRPLTRTQLMRSFSHLLEQTKQTLQTHKKPATLWQLKQ